MESTPRPKKTRRRLALAGGAVALTAGAVGGVIAMRAPVVQAASVSAPVAAPAAADPAETAPAPDTDNLQQGDQSGAPDTASAPDAAATTTAPGASTATEPASTEPDAAGGHADAAGATGQDGNFNN